MSTVNQRHTLPLAALTIAIVLLVLASGALAAGPPVKLIANFSFGREVNLTHVTAKAGPELEDICTVASKDQCQPGKESSIPGGFGEYGSEGVATNNDPSSPQYEDVYVTDKGNHRVQIFTAGGVFLSMFGWEVNETKVEAIKSKGGTPSQTEIEEENICTAASKDACKAGVEGTAAEHFNNELKSVTVNPDTGEVYVDDAVSSEAGVYAYTPEGKFVRTVGHFSADYGSADLLAAGGPEDLLYVGEADGVQEIDPTTLQPKGEIAGGNQISAVAVDEAGDVYLIEGEAGAVYKFNVKGEKITEFPLLPPKHVGAPVGIRAIALDPAGYLAIVAWEDVSPGITNISIELGLLYDSTTGHLITEFPIPGLSKGVAFNSRGEMYAGFGLYFNGGEGVDAYRPVNVAELATTPVTCGPGADEESSVTLDCALNGMVNSEGVSETEAFFEWGRTQGLGFVTSPQAVATGGAFEPVEGVVEGVRPNETFYDRVAGYDANVKSPELLTSEVVSFATPLAAPRIVGETSVPFVGASSAVMYGQVNPENANTRYEFQYARTAACVEREEQVAHKVSLSECPGVLSTSGAESDVYGVVGSTQEATGLQPATAYEYRMVAESENGSRTERVSALPGAEGSFTTGPAPVVSAQTGVASGVGSTSAAIAGSVDPDGQPAVYKFELGVYAGVETRYGIVFSGTVGASTVPVAEALGLTGLQPGTEYAYRVKLESGYGEAYGAMGVFTTEGVPTVLVSPFSLAQLAAPAIAFPIEAKAVTVKVLTNAQKLASALKACRKESKGKRASCEAQARRRYGKSNEKGAKARRAQTSGSSMVQRKGRR